MQKWASDETDLATWLRESTNRYSETLSLEGVPAGSYSLVTGLVDRKNNLEPGLDAAVAPELKIGGWIKVKQIDIK